MLGVVVGLSYNGTDNECLVCKGYSTDVFIIGKLQVRYYSDIALWEYVRGTKSDLMLYHILVGQN